MHAWHISVTFLSPLCRHRFITKCFLFAAETNGELPVKEELPFTPNYLAHPPFPYLSHPMPRPVRNESPVNLSLGMGTGGGHMPSPIPTSQQQYGPAVSDPDGKKLFKYIIIQQLCHPREANSKLNGLNGS